MDLVRVDTSNTFEVKSIILQKEYSSTLHIVTSPTHFHQNTLLTVTFIVLNDWHRIALSTKICFEDFHGNISIEPEIGVRGVRNLHLAHFYWNVRNYDAFVEITVYGRVCNVTGYVNPSFTASKFSFVFHFSRRFLVADN